MKNILEKIIEDKKKEIALKKKLIPLKAWHQLPFYKRETISLKDSLCEQDATGIIAEFKRKSPSKGIINADADIEEIIAGYDEYASGISILTDEMHFGGTNDDMLIAASIASVPLLRKDFIIDAYQLHEAKAIGTDVILLIAACLSKNEVADLAKEAKALKLEVLLELHDEDEIEHICDDIDMVGINNRNLKTFKVDIERSLRMSEKIPAGKIKIAESGISSVENILLFKKYGFKGFLIGENFMKEHDPAAAFASFITALKKANNEN